MTAISAVEPRPDVRAAGSDAADEPLLERAAELAALGDAVARAAGGRGAIVVLEAAAGLGKTALLDRAGRLAEGAGCELRRAAPGPLERHLPFGVVRALLEAPLRGASEQERERLLEGAAGAAGRLLLGGPAPDGCEATMTLAHSAFWLCAALGAARPLVLVVDDAQWSDRPSLQVLSYLARRIEELPVVIAVGARAGDPDAPSDLLSLLGGVAAATVLRPQPLTVWGAIALIRRQAPDAPLRACRDCQRAAGGSPWLLGELARQLAAYGSAAPDAAGRRAPAVSAVARDVVRRRLAGLAPRARAVAAALAVLGPGAPPHVVAALAGAAVGELAPARDALHAAGLLAADRARLAHGLIATAVIDDLAGSERERLHREAARLLAEDDASMAAVAAQLLECEPHGDPEVSRLLVRAAADAAQRGEPRAAAGYLERAMDERARADERGPLLAQLAAARFDAGLPDARRLLHEALRELDDRASRVDVLTRLAALQGFAGRDERLMELLDGEAPGAGDPAIEVAALDALLGRGDGGAERARRLAALGAVLDPALARAVDAHRAWAAAESAGAGAGACAALALAALEDGVLLGEAARRSGYHLAVRTLVATDHHADARRAIDALRAAAIARGSRPLRAAAACHAGELALRTGDIREAEREARAALELANGDLGAIGGGALELLVRALTERGAFDEAVALLEARGLDGARDARARLWLAIGEYERAHVEACEAGRQQDWTPWRATAALALAHLGRREEAAVLADEDVARAERFGAPAPLVIALHARALAEPDAEARIALCRRALGVAGGGAAVLDAVRVRLELGSTLARLGARVEARDELRPALAEADATGAAPLAERARRELVATGLRPRQAAIEGAAALTPRQRQVCTLAAAGKGNREIAHALFLSVKTVETHLAAGYRKLGVNSRAGLRRALGAS